MQNRLGNRIKKDVPLARLTSYRVGGPADLLAWPADEEELKWVLETANQYGVPYRVLGKGTNVLASDRGYRGLILNLMRHFRSVWQEGHTVVAQAGLLLQELLDFLAGQGLAGLEKLAGIPGTVGGAIHMNAGAFGTEISDRLRWIRVLYPDGHSQKIFKEEIPFGYRHGFREPGVIILEAAFELSRGDPEKLRKTMAEIIERRRARQPLSYPSAGSVFKRPEGHYAGALIEKAGLKGTWVGGAMISRKHANFILNKKKATARDIFELIQLARKKVKEKFGVDLELENELLGWEEDGRREFSQVWKAVKR